MAASSHSSTPLSLATVSRTNILMDSSLKNSFTQSLMVHFNTLYYSCNIAWRKTATILCLRTIISLSSQGPYNTTSFVNILEGEAQRLSVGQVGGRIQSVLGVVPFALPPWVTFHSVNQGMLALDLDQEFGPNATVWGGGLFLSVNTTFLKRALFLSWLKGRTVSCFTPSVSARRCAHVMCLPAFFFFFNFKTGFLFVALTVLELTL